MTTAWMCRLIRTRPIPTANKIYGAQTKREIRETGQVAVVTKMQSDMKIIPPFESASRVICPQGQPLHWLEYDALAGRHGFGVRDPTPLCGQCWEASDCLREFEYAPAHHGTLPGLIPLSTRPAQPLLQQARSWIEPCQSFEKNVLGLNAQFLNSLRRTWSLGLLADAVALLRHRTLLEMTPTTERLENLPPKQGVFDLET